jgi:DNA modification methylase
VVFDPFMGAGTTAIVAQELGRNYIELEVTEEYIKIAEERWKKCKSVCFILKKCVFYFGDYM